MPLGEAGAKSAPGRKGRAAADLEGNLNAARREIRLVLQKYQLPVTGPLFDNAYAYIRENY